VSGIYARPELRPPRPYSVLTEWSGDEVRLLNLQAILNVINWDNLIYKAEYVGMHLKSGLMELSERYRISNVRGYGTLLAYDFDTPEDCMKFIAMMA